MEIPKRRRRSKNIAGARNLRRDVEMAWAPPRNMSNWPDWEEARSVEESEWRLEPEGEAEVPEIIVVSDAVESTEVDLDGKSRRKQAEERSFRREREAPGKGGCGNRRNAGLRERSKERGAGRSGREDFRTERDKRSAKAVVSL